MQAKTDGKSLTKIKTKKDQKQSPEEHHWRKVKDSNWSYWPAQIDLLIYSWGKIRRANKNHNPGTC